MAWNKWIVVGPEGGFCAQFDSETDAINHLLRCFSHVYGAAAIRVQEAERIDTREALNLRHSVGSWEAKERALMERLLDRAERRVKLSPDETDL